MGFMDRYPCHRRVYVCPHWENLTYIIIGPLKRPHGALNKVLDKYGESISFYQDVPDILRMLRTRGKGGGSGAEKVIVAACSRTEAPSLCVAYFMYDFHSTVRRARQCLQLLHLPGMDHPALPAIEFFDELEIYPCMFLLWLILGLLSQLLLASKLKHFQALHERTGIPYTDMLFFDDESRNAEVERLGKYYLIPSMFLCI